MTEAGRKGITKFAEETALRSKGFVGEDNIAFSFTPY